LPDEKNLLRQRRSAPPRRLLPAESAAAPMYVGTPGARVGRDGGRVVVTHHDDKLGDRRLIDLSQLVVFGNVSVSTQLVRELMSRDIPICYFSAGGWFSGMTHGLPSKNVELRRKQALLSDQVQLGIAARMVEAKILNSRTLLRRNAFPRDDQVLREMKRLAIRAGRVPDAEQLLGVEGAAAKFYFSRFASMLKVNDVSFDFAGRNRRPPVDRVNALLSFVYGLLVRDLTATAFSVGLDPYLGVFHRPRFGRPAVALDLAEEFRPLIADSVVIGLINNREMGRSDFVEGGGGVSLSHGGRTRVLKAYERRITTEFIHPMFKYGITYRRALEVQCRLLAAVILSEFDEYVGVVTR
jgi:CRISPR-associated protein Cas1